MDMFVLLKNNLKTEQNTLICKPELSKHFWSSCPAASKQTEEQQGHRASTSQASSSPAAALVMPRTEHNPTINQNHREMSPRTSQNGHCPKEKKQQVSARMWRKGSPPHCWWACKSVQPLWKADGRILKKLKL